MFKILLSVCLLISGVTLLSHAQDSVRVDVNLVNIFLTVQDQSGEFIAGLSSDDFRVYEDGIEQKIEVFETEDVESAIGILIDNSGSMVDVLPRMKAGLLDFARKSRGFEELFVMTFGTSVQVLHDIGQPIRTLETRLEGVRPRGTSVLFDALVEGMQKLSHSEHTRKALIVFTDGWDNASLAGFGKVLLEAQRSGVLLYFIPIGSRILVDDHTIEALANSSGGRVQYLSKVDPVPPALDGIRTELARQYYLAYYSPPRPGFHRLRVELPGRELRVRAKTGYSGN